MKLEILNESEWIKDQLEIIKKEFQNNPVILKTYQDVDEWLNNTDLIQVLTENFDYEAELSETKNFTNEEFAKQFIKLFQKLKTKIIEKFLE